MEAINVDEALYRDSPESGPVTNYIYGLLCPKENLIRYVGSSRYPARRYKHHTSAHQIHLGNMWKSNPHLKETWVATLHAEGLMPELVILQRLTDYSENPRRPDPEVRRAEYQWILKLIQDGHTLLNHNAPIQLTEEECRELDEAIQLNHAIQRGHTLFGEQP